MKKQPLRLALTVLSSVILVSIIPAQAGKQIGRGVLELQVSASASSTDNLSANALSDGDEYIALNPVLTYIVETPRLNFNSSLALPINRFNDRTEFDSEDIIFSIGSSLPFLPNSPLYGDADFSYSDTVEVDYLVNGRFASESTRFGISGGIRLGQHFDLRGGVDYNKRLTEQLSDYQQASYYGGIQFNEVMGSANAYIDYRFQKRETIGGFQNDGIDDIDEGIRFGMNGQILPERLFPKLEADLSFGFSKSEDFRDSGGNDDFLIISGSLMYPATPKTNVAFNVSRNLSVSNLDQNVEQFTTSLTLNQNPRQNLNFNWSIGYEVNDFGFSQTTTTPNRKDTTLFANGTVNFIFSSPWFATLGANFRDTESNDLFRDYSSTTFFLSTTRIF